MTDVTRVENIQQGTKNEFIYAYEQQTWQVNVIYLKENNIYANYKSYVLFPAPDGPKIAKTSLGCAIPLTKKSKNKNFTGLYRSHIL